MRLSESLKHTRIFDFFRSHELPKIFRSLQEKGYRSDSIAFQFGLSLEPEQRSGKKAHHSGQDEFALFAVVLKLDLLRMKEAFPRENGLQSAVAKVSSDLKRDLKELAKVLGTYDSQTFEAFMPVVEILLKLLRWVISSSAENKHLLSVEVHEVLSVILGFHFGPEAQGVRELQNTFADFLLEVSRDGPLSSRHLDHLVCGIQVVRDLHRDKPLPLVSVLPFKSLTAEKLRNPFETQDPRVAEKMAQFQLQTFSILFKRTQKMVLSLENSYFPLRALWAWIFEKPTLVAKRLEASWVPDLIRAFRLIGQSNKFLLNSIFPLIRESALSNFPLLIQKNISAVPELLKILELCLRQGIEDSEIPISTFYAASLHKSGLNLLGSFFKKDFDCIFAPVASQNQAPLDADRAVLLASDCSSAELKSKILFSLFSLLSSLMKRKSIEGSVEPKTGDFAAEIALLICRTACHAHKLPKKLFRSALDHLKSSISLLNPDSHHRTLCLIDQALKGLGHSNSPNEKIDDLVKRDAFICDPPKKASIPLVECDSESQAFSFRHTEPKGIIFAETAKLQMPLMIPRSQSVVQKPTFEEANHSLNSVSKRLESMLPCDNSIVEEVPVIEAEFDGELIFKKNAD